MLLRAPFRLVLRRIHRRSDPRFLAEALNLLSRPAEAGEIHTANAPPPTATPDAPKYTHYLNNLVVSLLAPAADALLLAMAPQAQLDYVRRVSDPTRLRQLVDLFASHRKLTPQLLTDIVLNRHFELAETVPLVMNTRKWLGDQWTPLQHTQFDIVLLKKWDDAERPLYIIKNLKQNFSSYLDLIKRRQLSPFFERIVWKYTFEYIRHEDEVEYVEHVVALARLAWLILEVLAPAKMAPVAEALLRRFGDLTPLERLFLRTTVLVPLQLMKRLSIKHRPWHHPVLTARQVALVQAMETRVVQELLDTVANAGAGLIDERHRQLVELVSDLKHWRDDATPPVDAAVALAAEVQVT